MGQYYAPVVVDQRVCPSVRWWFFAHIYGNGLKLMEHSYCGNGFVRAVETFLRLDGGMRVVWAGDYADEEPDGQTLYEKTMIVVGDGRDHDYGRCVVIPAGLEAPYRGYEDRLAAIAACGQVVDVRLATDDECRYVMNLDRELFVDTELAPLAEPGWDARIHPLPLLTCEGNGRGGGDYQGDSPVVGSWARDRITVGPVVPAGFAELDFAGALAHPETVPTGARRLSA